jgi:hypothetical protein
MPEPNVKKLKEFLEHTTSIFKSLEKELVRAMPSPAKEPPKNESFLSHITTILFLLL